MTVELRDARGNALRRMTDRATDLAKVLPPVGDPDFPMLGLVDPYGDTIFSALQMRAVIPELQRLKQLTGNSEVLEDVEELAVECADGVHVFLVFVGD
ncbi:MAG: hypothetical protein ACRDZ7_14390 [Acidimicrobiia bacterium]